MKKIILIASLFVFLSCAQEESARRLNVIDLESNVGITRTVNLSEIAESIHYIPLETTSESLLATPFIYLHLENEVLYIQQFRTEIKLFSKNGSFIRTFNRLGNGPQEYEFLSNLDIDPATNNIIIHSFGKYIEYDASGKYIGRVLFDDLNDIKTFGPYRLFRINENLNVIMFNKYTSKYSACVTDSLFNVLYYISYSEIEQNVRNKNQLQINITYPYFYKFNDSLRLFNGYDDNILSVSNSSGFDTSFILNYGKYDYRNVNLNTRGNLKMPFIYRYYRALESSNYLFMQFSLGSLPHKPMIKMRPGKTGERRVEVPISASLFNKKTGEFQFVDQPVINQYGFIDDFEGGPAFWPLYISANDIMVSIIDAHNFIEFAQTNKVSDKFRKVAEELNEDSNPVLK